MLTLDPMAPEGQEIVRKLVATADVVIANLPPQTLSAMKLDYEFLKAVKPDIILTTVTAYGRGGPYSDRVGFDGVGQVMSGAVYMTGTEDQPYRAAGTVGRLRHGAALRVRHHGGADGAQGNRQGPDGCEGALLATAVTFGNALLIEQAVIQANRVPTGNRGQTAAPVDIFRTRDGWILAQVIGAPLFKRWAKLMGEEHWLTDARFKDDIARGDNGAIISERMSRWCAERTTAEALEILGDGKDSGRPGAQAAADAGRSPHQGHGLLPGRPSFQAHPGRRRSPRCRCGCRKRQAQSAIAPPTLGEHTDRILTELGYDAAAIAALRQGGII